MTKRRVPGEMNRQQPCSGSDDDCSPVLPVPPTLSLDMINRYKLLAEKARDIIIFVNPDGNIIEANAAAVQAYGYRREDLLRLSVYDLRADQERALVFSQMARARENGILFETVHKRRDGSLFPVEVNSLGTAVKSEHVVVSIIRDISDRKAVENALRLSEEKFSKVFHTSPDAICLNRMADGMFIDVNEGFSAVTGYLRDEIVGKTSAAVGLWFNAEDRESLIREVAARGKVENRESLFRRRDGRLITGQISARRLNVNAEECLICVARDISERKRMEEKLRESEERYRSILEQSREAIMLIDTENQRLLEANPMFCQLSGYQLADVAKLTIFDVLDDEPGAIRALFHEDVVNIGYWPPAVRKLKCRDGSNRKIERSGSVIHYGGRRVFACVFRDVTVERSRQEQMQRDFILAGKLQQGLLPAEQEHRKVSIRTVYEPYLLVSGDYFYYSWSDNQRSLRGYLVDVTGHGLATALQTSAISGLFREAMNVDDGAAGKLCWLNRQACAYFSDDSFAAVLYFEFDFAAMTLTYCSGGINYFYSSSSQLHGMVKVAGTFLGISAGAEFEQHTIPIQHGDTFYFMSDGLFDLLATDSLGNLWNYDETVAILRETAISPRRWDDAAGVMIRINQGIGYPQTFVFRGFAELQHVRPRINQLLRELLGKPVSLVTVAVNEALNNALQYGGGEVHIKIRLLSRQRLEIKIRDGGDGFAAKQRRLEPPAIWQEGGRGILIMTMAMDQIIYNEQGNEVTLVKQL